MPNHAPLHSTYLSEPCGVVFKRYEGEIARLNEGWRSTNEINLRLCLENAKLHRSMREAVEYLDPRVGHLPESRGFALLQRLNAALIRKD